MCIILLKMCSKYDLKYDLHRYENVSVSEALYMHEKDQDSTYFNDIRDSYEDEDEDDCICDTELCYYCLQHLNSPKCCPKQNYSKNNSKNNTKNKQNPIKMFDRTVNNYVSEGENIILRLLQARHGVTAAGVIMRNIISEGN